MSRKSNTWLACTSLLAAVALACLPVVQAADPGLAPEGKINSKQANVLTANESTPLSNELYHNDLTPGVQFRIVGQTTALHGDAITMQDYGAGLEVRLVNTVAATQLAIPGRCAQSGTACTGLATDCAGESNVCVRTGVACAANSECTLRDAGGLSYEYCDVCAFEDDWVHRLRIYDAYDAGASPVHSGLLATKYRNVGGVWQATNNVSWVYNFAAGELVLADPDIFYTLEAKLVPFGGSVQVTDAQFDAAGWALGGSWNFRGGGNPERGASDTSSYVDRNGDSVLDAADLITGYSVAGCPAGGCQANLRMFVQGLRNPALLDRGSEYYSVAGNGSSYFDLDAFDGFFDLDRDGNDCTNGTGTPSTALQQRVTIQGLGLENNVTVVAPIQAIFDRATDILLPGVAPFTVFAFSAANQAAVVVDRGGVPELWDVFVCRSGSVSGGTHTLARQACTSEGGSITSTLNWIPKLTFVRRDGTCAFDFDTGIASPMTSAAYKWHDAPSFDQITVGAGIQFDRNCAPGVEPPGGQSNSAPTFQAGNYVPACDASCDSSRDPVTRLFTLTGPGWGLGFHQAVATGALADATDTDGDGILDGADSCNTVADPDQADSDNDGFGDACDNAPAACNPDQLDTDGDGIGDAADTCPNDPLNDVDGDGVCGDVDNCPTTANADQLDTDGDGIGDACDACPLDANNDADGDGVCGNVDNCPADANADQANADGDQYGDVCDPCPMDADNDIDGDGVCGNVDNCPLVANPDQLDSDGDGVGDACPTGPGDSDGDGVPDDQDACPNSILDPTVVVPPTVPGGPPPPGTTLPCNSGVPNYLIGPSAPGTAAPAAGCTISDKIAACDANSRNKGQFEKCVKSLTKQLKRQGVITEKQRKAIDKCAKKYKKRDIHASSGASSVGGNDL